MQSALSTLSGLQAEVEARMQEARIAMEEEQANLNSAGEMLSNLAASKAQMTGEVQMAVGELKTQKRALSDLDNHLSRIDQVQAWVERNREPTRDFVT